MLLCYEPAGLPEIKRMMISLSLTPDCISSLHVLSTVGTACHKQYGRCNVSECVQETFGRSATEEDGFLYGLVVRKTLLAAGSFLCYCKTTLLMIAIGAAIPGAITRCDQYN